MLILCPNCRRKSRIKNPPASITTLKIRCAVCKHVFVPVASDVEEDTAEPVATASESGFRGTTKSIDVSEIVRQSFVGPNPLRTGSKTDITLGLSKRSSGTLSNTNPSIAGPGPRVKTDLSLASPPVPRGSSTAPSRSASPSTSPPAPVVAPPAQGAPRGASEVAASGVAQALPMSRKALWVSSMAALVGIVGFLLGVFLIPQLPGWAKVAGSARRAQVSAVSEVPGIYLAGAQFLTWAVADSVTSVVVIGSVISSSSVPSTRPDVVLRLRDKTGQVVAQTRAPLGVSASWAELAHQMLAEMPSQTTPWLEARAQELGLLAQGRETGFRVALPLPLEAADTLTREIRVVARGAQPATK